MAATFAYKPPMTFAEQVEQHNNALAQAKVDWAAAQRKEEAAKYDTRPKTIGAAASGIGDVKSDAKGSGARYNAGKADLSLIPLCTLEDEARVWMHGAEKYAAWNWMKGMPWSAPLACALRHLAAWQRGENTDPESGQPHLAHAMCNLRMLTLYARTYPEGDDRPTGWLTARVGAEGSPS